MAYNVKFLKGTADSYAGLATKDINTFYYVDNKDLYLGTIKLSNGADLDAAVVRVAANEGEIASIKQALGNLTQQSYDALVQRVGEAEGKITTLEGKMTTVEGKVSTLEGEMDAVEGKVTTLEGEMDTVEGKVASLESNSATKTELKATDDIAKANQAAIEVLNGTGEGSVSAQVAAGVASIVASAPEDFDTLKEVADWIANDKTGAAALQAAVADHETRLAAAELDIDGLQEDVEEISGKVSANEGAIATNVEEIGKNAAAIAKNAEDIAKNAESIGENADAIAAEKERAEGVEGGLNTRLLAVEQLAGIGGGEGQETIADQIAAAKDAAIAAANQHSDEANASLASTLRGEIQTAKEGAVSDANGYTDGKIAELAGTVEKAASALQKADITTGSANGTIQVKGDDVAVKGLGSAAFVGTDAFDAAGQAASALQAANAHTDAALANYYTKTEVDGQHASLTSYVDTALTWGTI